MSDYHARHLGGGLIALYRGDEQVREIGITPGWHFKDRDEFIARYNRDTALQSEKARADALEAELAALKARIERLVARMQLDLGAGKEGYTYTQYEQGRIAEKRKTLHELSTLLPADGEG